LKQVARLTASLHKSVHCPALPSLPAERFEVWFEDWLVDVMHAADYTKPLATEFEFEARKLLTREKNAIQITLEKTRQLTQRARAIAYDPVLTHGDLKYENLIKDSGGCLHIIDWSKIAIAPPERDLVNFVGERFELFLEAYLSSYDKAPRLHPELFEFYSYFLILWGIADYGSWILLEDGDLKEKEHALRELRKLLHVNQEQCQVDAVGRFLQRVIDSG
jgi:hypothetical protein